MIDRPNQVWAADITYLPMANGFVYLVAILDLYSRKVMAWRTSNTMSSDFCVEALQEALTRFGCPEVFNTDQGSQFTAEAFTGVLASHGVRISMDGKGRWIDNVFVERLWRSVKYEEVYLHAYETPKEVNGRARQVLCFLQLVFILPHLAMWLIDRECLGSRLVLQGGATERSPSPRASSPSQW